MKMNAGFLNYYSIIDDSMLKSVPKNIETHMSYTFGSNDIELFMLNQNPVNIY